MIREIETEEIKKGLKGLEMEKIDEYEKSYCSKI